MECLGKSMLGTFIHSQELVGFEGSATIEYGKKVLWKHGLLNKN